MPRSYRTTQTRNRRRLTRGGRFIAQGTFGCTFRKPPLKCTSEPTRRGANTISKYSRIEGLDKELKMNQAFRAIDPTEKYFLTVQTQCELNRTAIVPENEFDKCRVKNVPGSLLLMAYGGTSLFDLPFASDTILPILSSFTNLFDGLSLAHANHLYHLDVKTENIVCLGTADQTVRTRYIDFGLSQETNTIVPSLLDAFTQFHRVYAFHPFEDIIMFGSARYPDESNEQIEKRLEPHFKLWFQGMKEYNGTIMPLFLSETNTPFVSIYDIQTDLEAVLTQFHTMNEMVSHIYALCDTFALGCVLGHIFYKLQVEAFWDTRETPALINFRFRKSSTTKVDFVFNRLAEIPGATPELSTYFKQVKGRFFSPLFNLIGDMTSPLIRERISLADAKPKYEAILATANQLFTPDLVEKYFSQAKRLYKQMQKDALLAERTAMLAKDPTLMPTYQNRIGLDVFGMPPPAPLGKRLRNRNNIPNQAQTRRRKGTPMPPPPKPNSTNGI